MTMLNREEFNRLAKTLARTASRRRAVEAQIILMVKEGNLDLQEIRNEYLQALEEEAQAEASWKTYQQKVISL